MCGIAGIWDPSGREQGNALPAMLDAIGHRGPDGRGSMRYPGGSAGMVRLALVDLSDRGQQPLWSENRSVAILFNGEIYNFREERSRLEKKGFTFRTDTDTEVVLALYLERGARFVERLRGMYAVALFDFRDRSSTAPPDLLLARGPFGMKPLYVHEDGAGVITFASELKGLLASPSIPRRVSTSALGDYLRFGFVPPPRSILEGVRVVRQGTLERHRPGASSPEVSRFYSLPAVTARRETIEEAAERTREAVEESVRLHALADARVGAFLSGGIDSTIILSLMRRHLSSVRTYTLRFPEAPGADEVSAAAETARRLDCETQVVDVTAADLAESLPAYARDLDQPSSDGVNTWFVSRAAGRGVKAVLSGLGGDEWFAGYPVARRMARLEGTRRGRWLAHAARAAAEARPWLPRSLNSEELDRLIARKSPLDLWLQTHVVFRADEVVALTGRAVDDLAVVANELDRWAPHWREESARGLSTTLDVCLYLGAQLLRDSDATSMAHHLEVRAPFVDLIVAEVARSISDENRLPLDSERGRRLPKPALTLGMRDVLPDELVHRPKKGFVVPVYSWLEGPLRGRVDEMLRDESALGGLIDRRAVCDLLDRWRTDASLTRRVWSMLTFELWRREVIARKPETGAGSPKLAA
jgi:asparagine synthase (glutamine-hydrolysing)